MNAPLPQIRPAAATDTEPGLARITQPYLLLMFSVPFHVDAAGRRWIDALWAKDLLEHTRYIEQLTLAAPVTVEPAPEGAVAMDEPGFDRVRCVDLPHARSYLKALLTLPRTLGILWRELGRTKIVHSGVASWPLPDAWLVVPMLWLRRRLLYINVESAFWRLVPGERVRFTRRWSAAFNEFVNRACVERSDLSTFTHEGYRTSLLTRNTARGHVVEASWIDQRNLISTAELASDSARRRDSTRRLRLVFAGRLNAAKGVPLLVDAAAALLQAGVALELDLFGVGPLEAELSERLRDPELAPWIRLRGVLPYGDQFFATLRGYDALVVPSISDEQPRIVYDAFSQGLPVIASRTAGLAQCVQDGVTGLLFTPGDGTALQQVVERVALDREALTHLSQAGLARASRLTHRHMHEVRRRLLLDAFPHLADARAA